MAAWSCTGCPGLSHPRQPWESLMDCAWGSGRMHVTPDSKKRSPNVRGALICSALTMLMSMGPSAARADAGMRHIGHDGANDISATEIEANARRLAELEARREADLEEQAQRNHEYRNIDPDATKSVLNPTNNNENAIRPIQQSPSSRARRQADAPGFASPYVADPDNSCLVHESRADQPGWNNRCDSSIEVYWCSYSQCEIPDTHVTVIARGWTNAAGDASEILVCPSQYILRSDYKCHGHSQ